MIVVGLDLGRANLGWAKIRVSPRLELLGHGVVGFPSLPQVERYHRVVSDAFSGLLSDVQAVAAERITYFTKRQESRRRGSATKTWVEIACVGMSMIALCDRLGIEYRPVSAQQAKMRATGSRSASKEALAQAVQSVLPDFGVPAGGFHDTDAAAIALGAFAPEVFIGARVQ